MNFFFEFIKTIFTLLFLFLIIIVVFLKYKYKHWIRHNIAQTEPNLLFGDIKQVLLLQEPFGTVFHNIYNLFKRQNLPYGGYYFFHLPELMILDLDLIKKILVKDFHYFTDRGIFTDEETDPFTGNLFTIANDKWKYLRDKLSPTFTSGKMKMMFPTLVACSDELNSVLTEISQSGQPLEVKDILARFTTDVIGNCVFGINCNSLKNPDNEFRKFGKLTFEPQKFVEKFRATGATLFPKFYKLFKITAISKEITSFYTNTVLTTIKYREENNIVRKDFMDLLIQLKNYGQIKDEDNQQINNENPLSIEQIAAQCFVFFVAGFETSSTTVSFCLYELVKNPKIQNKLRTEINSVLSKYGGKITYDAVMEMEYLDKVISETFRKYPPMPFLSRRCTQDYQLPKSNYVIRKGDKVRISVLGLHRNPEYFPNPEKFDPERFSAKEKEKISHFTYLPFGEGPRFCIGFRFGKMQAKIGLIIFLQNYKLMLNKKTIDPLKFNPNNVNLGIKGGLWLNILKI